MGEALAAALGVDIPEADFWALTPYRLSVRIRALLKTASIGHLHIGWFAERFAREDKLQGPQTYVKQFFQLPNEAEAEAQAKAMFHRMAQDWGLKVEAYSE